MLYIERNKWTQENEVNGVFVTFRSSLRLAAQSKETKGNDVGCSKNLLHFVDDLI